MIKKLKRQFILISMGAIALVLGVIFLVLNMTITAQLRASNDRLLDTICNNDGILVMQKKNKTIKQDSQIQDLYEKFLLISFELSEETPFETRYFSVIFDENNQIKTVNTNNIAAIDASDAKEMAMSAINNQQKSGYMNHGIYKYRISLTKDGDTLVAFLDVRNQVRVSKQLLNVSMLVGSGAMVFVFILVSLFSTAAVRPYAESLEKQKRFITDASHEIKTPLAIMMADCDVLEIEQEGNKWVQGIKKQITRLNSLVASLLTLAKMDENAMEPEMERFNLSDALIDVVKPFEAAFQKTDKLLSTQIEENLFITADEGDIRQVFSILIDNALKHSASHTQIQMRLYKERGTIKFLLSNPAPSLSKEDVRHLFDRFYRSDTSRNRESGGYGLGLCIARNLMEKNKGSLTAKKQNDTDIVFTVKF